MRPDETASGVFIIAPTPFREDGSLDLANVPRMVEFFLERGVQGLTVLGMMDEATKLLEDESRLLVREVLSATAGRVQPRIGLAAHKHILARRGAIASPAMRRPAVQLCADDLADIAFLLARPERRLATLAPSAWTKGGAAL